jgi:hypothetical protein
MGNPWIDRIKNHPAHAALADLEVALKEASGRSENSDAAAASIARVRQIMAVCFRALSAADPIFVTLPSMLQLAAHLTGAAAEIRSFTNNGNEGHLDNANREADAILDAVRSIRIPLIPDEVKDLGDAVVTVRESMDKQLADLRVNVERTSSFLLAVDGRVEAAKTHAESIQAEIAAQKGRLDQAITDFISNSSAAETARQGEFSQSESRRLAVASEAEQKRVEQSTQAEEQRRLASATLAEERAKAFEAIKVDWSESAANRKAVADAEQKARADAFEVFLSGATKAKTDWESSAEETTNQALAMLDEKKAKAEELVHVIANTGMTGGYQRVANTEQWTARFWQLVALVAMSGLIGFAIYAAANTVGKDFQWPIFAGRSIVAVACGILGTYAARQAQKHLEFERQNRRLQLELASIDPYLASLPDDKRIEVKRQLAERFFGQPINTDLTDEKTAGTLLDVVKAALDAVVKLAERK